MFSRHARILVIDDMQTMNAITQKLLSELEFDNIDICSSGSIGLASLENSIREGRPYSLVITDWMMPGISGLDLFQKCKSHTRLKDIPFLFISAENKLENIKVALQAGVFDYLLKPFTRDHFKEKLARITEIMREVKTFPKTSHILLAEDSKATLMGLQKMLGSLGYIHLHCFPNGKDALSYLLETANGKHQKIDFSIVDWQMPTLTGLELYRRVKEHQSLNKIPFLLSTAEDCEINLKHAVEMGISEYLIKPYDLNELKQKIARTYRVQQGLEAPPRDSKILIVDDFDTMIKIHVANLKNLGYNDFFCVKNGESALAELKKAFHHGRPYDFVITDWHMPKVSGIELTKRCRSDIFLRHTPILMITGDENESGQASAIKDGVDEFLVKPYKPQEFELSLERLYTKMR